MEETLKCYGVCKNGEIVYKYTKENKESYSFYKFEFSGNAFKTIAFYRNDSNGNGVYDENDEYECKLFARLRSGLAVQKDISVSIKMEMCRFCI